MEHNYSNKWKKRGDRTGLIRNALLKTMGYNNYVNGNREKAIEIHNELLPMLNHIRQNVEQIISFEKRILYKRGIIGSDYCRKPSYNTDPYFDKLFDEFYEKMSIRYNW